MDRVAGLLHAYNGSCLGYTILLHEHHKPVYNYPGPSGKTLGMFGGVSIVVVRDTVTH